MVKKILLAAALAAFSGLAFAEGPPFEAVDTNSDGWISPEEAAVVEGLDFGDADTNGDGKLSPEEYEAAMAE